MEVGAYEVVKVSSNRNPGEHGLAIVTKVGLSKNGTDDDIIIGYHFLLEFFLEHERRMRMDSGLFFLAAIRASVSFSNLV